ncbi:hypothetical protein BU14_0071s0035 [Porphyra umbilicalis]|uniref:Uncharacterized protein n=1 Tax=Porphyra umbilicalis TaxID=2786 RepID=A0A1X6PG05_PORUM|nr:hypothetical protein BU14_0071s0035 [Porphyra umbilicalis]|eukprot:OSX79781.1 hypothetical protein BU14_0071s0035 [Porphyra umbilicalis]
MVPSEPPPRPPPPPLPPMAAAGRPSSRRPRGWCSKWVPCRRPSRPFAATRASGRPPRRARAASWAATRPPTCLRTRGLSSATAARPTSAASCTSRGARRGRGTRKSRGFTNRGASSAGRGQLGITPKRGVARGGVGGRVSVRVRGGRRGGTLWWPVGVPAGRCRWRRATGAVNCGSRARPPLWKSTRFVLTRSVGR